MRRAVVLLILTAGCSVPDRQFLDRRDRALTREAEQLDVPRKQREAAVDMSGWPPSNAGGWNYSAAPRP